MKRAFITGAASGLGRSMCLILARKGWELGISDLNENGLQETQMLIEELGGRAESFVFDVADEIAFQKASTEFLSKHGGIDLLINNAGVGDGSVFENYSLENWKWIIGVNQMGVINGCHFFVPIMKEQGFGHILNISSAASFSMAPRMSAYNTTKAAVKALSETLKSELAEFGIGVSLAMPFFFQTNVMQYARGDEESTQMGRWMVGSAGLNSDEMAERILKKCFRDRFYILEPWQAKFFFIFSRFAPRLLMWFNAKSIQHKQKWKHKLEGRYTKASRSKTNA